MMIGFDAKRAAQNKTGLGNYSRFVIEALTRFAPNERYLLYIPNPNRTSSLNGIEKANNVELRYPQTTFWKKFRSLWRVWGITSDIEKENIRLFHGLSNELPLNIRKAENTRSIVTIHDLIFLRYPEYYHYIDRKIYAYKLSLIHIYINNKLTIRAKGAENIVLKLFFIFFSPNIKWKFIFLQNFRHILSFCA